MQFSRTDRRLTTGLPTLMTLTTAVAFTVAAILPTAAAAADGTLVPGLLDTQVVETELPFKVVDPGFDGPATTVRSLKAEGAAQSAAYPLAQSLALHSSPGSRRTVHLDFDGSAGLGRAWQVGGAQPGWSLDADPAFNSQELAAVQDVWQMVAEDYAPFDVDVTTEDPGDAAITRSGTGDQVFGTRVLVTGSTSMRSTADSTVCGGGCGGVAWMGVFDLGNAHADYQPALVFPEHLGDIKSIADAASHEAGHTLGLEHDGLVAHDGQAAKEYHAEGALWGPVMGAPYASPLSQWSRGDYAWASQKQDDLAVVAAGGAPLRADVVGDTVGAAGPVPAATGTPAATGIVESGRDLDVYALGTCSGTVTAQAAPISGPGANLDLSLTLLDRSSTVLATADPTAAKASRSVATGLGATVSRTVAPGTPLYVRVDGVAGPGYTDYGSLGRYLLSASGCTPTGGGPGAPGDLTAVVAPGGPAGTVDVSWTPPSTGPVAGYTLSVSPGGLVRELPGTATGSVLSDLRPGTSYVVSLLARNATGATGSQATTSVLVPARAPGAVASMAASSSSDTQAVLTWTPPQDDGGASVSGYRVQLGSLDQVFDANVRTVSVSGLLPGTTYTASVSPVNSAGTGPARSQTFTTPTAANGAATGPASTSTPGRSGTSENPTLRPGVAPSRQGAAKVGAQLSVRSGEWPVPVTVRYRWLLDGKALPGASRSSTRVPAAWAGKRLAVRLTVSAPGYAPVERTISWGRVRR